MADRVGVIAKGKLLLVDDKAALMKKLGKRELDLTLVEPMTAIPAELEEWAPTLENEGHTLRYVFDATGERTGIRRSCGGCRNWASRSRIWRRRSRAWRISSSGWWRRSDELRHAPGPTKAGAQ